MKDFRAISVVPGSNACAAAIAVAGKRVLGSAAPRLPLAECTKAADCKCRYQKFADRRDEEEDRRLFSTGIRTTMSETAQSRRKSKGRRESDG
jgi:hypothetical protein